MTSRQQEEDRSLDLVQSSPFERWLKNFAPYTQHRYEQRFERFVEAVKELKGLVFDDRELLRLAKSDPAAFSELLVDTYRHFRNQEYSPRYAAGIYDSMRSFARYNGVDNLGKTPRVIVDETVYTDSEPLTDDEAKRTEFASMTGLKHGLRNAAMVAVLRQSGQRRAVLTALKWGMVKKQVLDGGVVVVNVAGPLLNVWGVDVRKVKTRPYRFGWGTEATALIRQMMDERVAKGEPVDEESFLFRSYAELSGEGVAKRPLPIPDSTRGPPITEDIVWRVVTQSAKIGRTQKARKTDRGETVYRVQPKAFRPYFKAKVRQAFQQGAFKNLSMNFDIELVKHLMGQKCAYEDAYDRFSESFVREFYSSIDRRISLGAGGQATAYRHKVVDVGELAGTLDQGYELLKELSGSKYLVRIRE
ncbi:MAG: hypothetical protein JRN45_00755 [Nitrososphaerota archaeon]|nr:hypothetical protein [Nitrososphaerota archaeon]